MVGHQKSDAAIAAAEAVRIPWLLFLIIMACGNVLDTLFIIIDGGSTRARMNRFNCRPTDGLCRRPSPISTENHLIQFVWFWMEIGRKKNRANEKLSPIFNAITINLRNVVRGRRVFRQ